MVRLISDWSTTAAAIHIDSSVYQEVPEKAAESRTAVTDWHWRRPRCCLSGRYCRGREGVPVSVLLLVEARVFGSAMLSRTDSR